MFALHLVLLSGLSAFALDLFGFGRSPFPQGVAGALSFSDPLEGTEISDRRTCQS